MNVEEEVLHIKNKLSKMSNGDTTCRDQALDLLRTLKKMPISVELLAKTRIGLTVNTFRKSSLDDEVMCLAKEVLRDWKKLIPAHMAKNCVSYANIEKKKIESSKDDIKRSPLSMTSSSQIPIITTDVARVRCRELLENALILYGTVLKGCTIPKELATELEDVIFKELKESINCKKCLRRKERRERIKRMAELRKQEQHLAKLNLGPEQILEGSTAEIPQSSSNLENLLQRLQQMSVSSVGEQNQQDNISS